MNLDVYKIQYCTVQNVFQRTISIVFSFIKVEIYMNKTVVVAYESLKTNEKSSWVIPKSGCDRLQKRSLTKAFHYKVSVTGQTGFHKGGRN